MSLGTMLDAWDRAEVGCGVALLFFGGLSFTGVGFLMGLNSVRLAAGATRVQGEVVRHEERASTDSSRREPTYSPVVRFTTPQGRTTEFTSGTGSRPPRPRKGAVVTVLYHPESGEAEIQSFSTLWLFPIAFGAVGVAMLGVCALLFWLAFLRNPH
ncbi:MAG TPA: DUF3592 domain-containing protein [Vicinamibacteria bacterium]|nr:DUF3592 domain-containing protein [Vicinamibacteria bacterium]